jgi:Fuc2NAc and GlcNAc transferase
MTTLWPILAATVAASFVLTWLVRRYALWRGLLDHPNQRSSHELPTPRGGGVAIVVTFLAGLVVLWRLGDVPDGLFFASFGAGLWVAIVGFVDDHREVAAHWRLLAHAVAVGWIFYWLGSMPPLVVGGASVAPAWLATAATVVYILWVVNLYNFMDGIDGIAGIEAVTVCAGGACIYWVAFPGSTLWAVPALLLAGTAGFLVWNYPPARVFMGDVGSGFLGVTLAVLAVHSTSLGQRYFWAWTILLGVFVADASTTIVRRLWRKQRVSVAHRTHAYQYSARRLGRHQPVDLIVAAVNLFWLFPLSMLVALGRLDGALGLSIAYAPLILTAVSLKAGVPEAQEV